MACAGPGGGLGPGNQIPPELVAGVTAPQYGMTTSGTPIGLPGPPHIPFGVPAGLQKHVMRNHTFENIPGPVAKVKIDVKQKPGFSYPRPVSHVCIEESVLSSPAMYKPPNCCQVIGSGPIAPPPNCDASCASP